MPPRPKLPEPHLERIAQVLGDAATGSELTRLFEAVSLVAPPEGNTKWKRIYAAMVERQREDGCSNVILAFIQTVLDPARFLDEQGRYDGLLSRVNEILAFHGYRLGANGKFKLIPDQAETIDEAKGRANRLRKTLSDRGIHPEVLRFCRAELLQENYFHAVLEATKSVFDRLRGMTGVELDGANLIDDTFRLREPRIALNSLRSESEQSEQKGFANLLKGVYGCFRNPTAHTPRINWGITEADALDLLTVVSYCHRRLDAAVVLRKVT